MAGLALALALALVLSAGMAGTGRQRRLVSVAPATAVAAATAEPAVVTTARLGGGPEGEPAVVTATEDDRVGAALSLISYPWQEQLPGWQISFLEADDGYFGMTLVDDRRIEIYVRDEQGPADLAGVIAHELGHAVDVTLLCWGDRYDWLVARGHPPTARWYVSDGASDFESGAGDFAEAFAVWQVGRESWSRFAAAPTRQDLATVARLAHVDPADDERC